MMGYVKWQYISGPRWLATFGWNMQKVLLQYFSVGIMLRTLFAHWHRDALGYQGSLGDRFQVFVMNQVSRAVGFVIRMILITIWLLVAFGAIISTIIAIMLFVLWPFITIALAALAILMIFL